MALISSIRRIGGDAGIWVLLDSPIRMPQHPKIPIEIDRTAAHTGDHAGVFGFSAAPPHQNDVALGTVGIFKNAEDSTCIGSGLVP